MRTVNIRINYRNGGSEVRSIRTDADLTRPGTARTIFSATGTAIKSVEVVPATQRLSVPEPSGPTFTRGVALLPRSDYLD